MAKQDKAKKDTTKQQEAPAVEKQNDLLQKQEDVKQPDATVEKQKAPTVEKPKVEQQGVLETVKVIENFQNLYIAGNRYSGKKGETLRITRYVASILRKSGYVV